jgi:hypothetical protein
MTRRRSLIALLPAGLLAGTVVGFAQQPPTAAPADKENIAAALRLTQAAAAEYEFRVGKDEKPLELRREPVLKWSNPTQGEVHGNVFVWTRDGRPLVVGSLFKWFSPHTYMSHEFHSLAEEPLAAKFHGYAVWEPAEAGLRFAAIPKAPAPARTEAQRLLQLKQLAKEFAGSKARPAREMELRFLPQPIYRYSAPKRGTVQGAMFAFVQGTDPEIFLLIEARGKDAASAVWQFAAARMNSTQPVRLRHRGRQVWSSDPYPAREVFFEHKRPYTTFRFNEVPGFLGDALARPKP